MAISKNAKMKSGAKISIREDKWLKTGVTGGKFVQGVDNPREKRS